MHVLITADTLGGVWTYTRELVCGLLGRGHKVTLVSFGRVPSPAQSAWLQHRNLAHYPTSFPLEWMQDAEPGISQSENYLSRIIERCRPDVLHFSQFCYGAFDYGLPKVLVAHSDVISWWHAVHGAEPSGSYWLDWYKSLVSAGLQGADVVVAPSQWMLDTICKHYGRMPCMKVIYNGRSVNKFQSAQSKTDCVLTVGRIWDEAKQVSLLLARDHSVPVRIVGPVEHPEEASSSSWLLKESDDKTELCGEQDEAHLCALYADSAAYVATSRYEPFGLSPLEAALSQCALIANDIPVFHELWADTAFYFKLNDPDDLASAIAIVSQDSKLRAQYAALAYQRATVRFTAERMVTEYEHLYQSLICERELA